MYRERILIDKFRTLVFSQLFRQTNVPIIKVHVVECKKETLFLLLCFSSSIERTGIYFLHFFANL